MRDEVLHLKPYFSHTIWGGNRLREDFGYDEDGDDIGECWGISAHKSGESVVVNGEYAGKPLSEVWRDDPALFGRDDEAVSIHDSSSQTYSNADRPFPLLIKIIDAKDDLSIQVHPNDEYAKEHENGSLGKTECWCILDCKDNATIVIGHNAKTRDELSDMIHSGRWGELIREVPIKKGDFIQIDPGTVHAIKGGTLILETQQSSDITYRVYDYDRLQNGKPRELHINQSIDVINVPAASMDSCMSHEIELEPNSDRELVQCMYYRVREANVDGEYAMEKTSPYVLVTVIDGEGSVQGDNVKKGDHMIVTAVADKLILSGKMKAMIITER